MRISMRKTPGIYVCFRDSQFCFPSSVLRADVDVVVKVVASVLTSKSEYCCCDSCGEPFATVSKDGIVTIAEMAVSSSGMFLKSCVEWGV